jgi:hypothetical protein
MSAPYSNISAVILSRVDGEGFQNLNRVTSNENNSRDLKARPFASAIRYGSLRSE